MRLRLWEMISFAVLIVLTIGFGLLKSVWSGFTYFSVASVFVLCVLFIVNRILYIKDLKIEYDENLNLYLAEMLNNGYITRQQYNDRDPKIVKGYYKSYNRSKKLQILILVVLILIMASIVFVLVGL